jgi:hypothetical protein
LEAGCPGDYVCNKGHTEALLEVCQMLKNLHHELLDDGYKGIGAPGKGPDSEREGRK